MEVTENRKREWVTVVSLKKKCKNNKVKLSNRSFFFSGSVVFHCFIGFGADFEVLRGINQFRPMLLYFPLRTDCVAG